MSANTEEERAEKEIEKRPWKEEERRKTSKRGVVAAVIFIPSWAFTSEVNPDALYGHSYWLSNWKLETWLCPLSTAMLRVSWEIWGSRQPRSPRTFGLKTVWLSVAGCTFSLPPICLAALHSTWKYTQISSRQMAWSQAYETQALHVGGQCELSIIEFICTAINCSAEVYRYRYRYKGKAERWETHLHLCSRR